MPLGCQQKNKNRKKNLTALVFTTPQKIQRIQKLSEKYHCFQQASIPRRLGMEW